jgi:hypothetical protein
MAPSPLTPAPDADLGGKARGRTCNIGGGKKSRRPGGGSDGDSHASEEGAVALVPRQARSGRCILDLWDGGECRRGGGGGNRCVERSWGTPGMDERSGVG